MPITHTIQTSYVGDAGQVRASRRTFTGDGVVRYQGTIPAGATNMHINVSVTRAAVKSMVLYASKALTVKTNDATTPADTITLGDGEGRDWGNDESITRLFITQDVSALYVSNAGTAPAEFRFEALVDVTPGA